MNLVMLNEDIEKYRVDIVKILELFDELDYFEKYVKDLKPLYHPLEEEGLLRDDKISKFLLKSEHISPYLSDDGYIDAPPIKGVKKIRRGRK